jgi:hypothetical protein
MKSAFPKPDWVLDILECRVRNWFASRSDVELPYVLRRLMVYKAKAMSFSTSCLRHICEILDRRWQPCLRLKNSDGHAAATALT